jgi:hypothetical protein
MTGCPNGRGAVPLHLKHLPICLITAAILIAVYAPPRVYKVSAAAQPKFPATVANLATVPVPGEASVLLEAHQLALTCEIRPYWQETPLSKGEIPPVGELDDIIAHLMPCENIGRLLRSGTVDKVLHSKHRYSYGILMFQSSTWQGVEAGAGFSGTSLDTGDAIIGARRSIEHGYLWWSCARVLGVLK